MILNGLSVRPVYNLQVVQVIWYVHYLSYLFWVTDNFIIILFKNTDVKVAFTTDNTIGRILTTQHEMTQNIYDNETTLSFRRSSVRHYTVGIVTRYSIWHSWLLRILEQKLLLIITFEKITQ